jgi:hypothetical protein
VVSDHYWRARLRARGSARSRGSRVVSTHGLNTQRMSAVQKVWSSYVYATILLQHGLLQSCPFMDEERFKSKEDWKSLHGDVKEAIPRNAPEVCCDEVLVRHQHVDVDHAGEKLTHRSRTGCIAILNTALTNWFSKRQNSVESSTFESEFTALKIVTEHNCVGSFKCSECRSTSRPMCIQGWIEPFWR